MPARRGDVSIFRDTRAILVESIWWDAEQRDVVWVDITAGTLHRSPLDGSVDGSDDRVTTLPPPLSAVQPRRGGGFVAALRDRVVALDRDGAMTDTLAVIPHAHAGMRCNEGKVDPSGRFVVGAMDVTTGAPRAGLYAVDRGGLHVLRGGFGVANGFEWSNDGATMYVTDTATKTVYRGSYGPEGQLGDLEPFLVGHPSDGLALDTDGFFWNGLYGGSQVIRWSPAGEVVRRIRVPAPNVTSVAFGGDDGSTLFIGTARENLTETDLAKHPQSGGIFRVDVDAVGRPVGEYDDTTNDDDKDG